MVLNGKHNTSPQFLNVMKENKTKIMIKINMKKRNRKLKSKIKSKIIINLLES